MTQNATKIRWLLLLLIYLSCLIAYLDRMNMSVCAPMIMEHFGIDKIRFGMSMSAFAIAYTMMQIPGGLLSERFGIRLTGAVALLCWSLFTFVTPLAGSFMAFVAIRFLFGLGEGPLFPNNGAFLTRWFGPHEKALSSSIMISRAFVGPAPAPPLAVWVPNSRGW